MTLNTVEIPQRVPLTEERLRAGIIEINDRFMRARGEIKYKANRKTADVRPKNYSALYPSVKKVKGDIINAVGGVSKLDKTINLVCKIHDISKSHLLGGARGVLAIKARRCLSVALRAGGWSLPRIGKLMNRDHTSVLHNLRQFEKKATEDERKAASYVTEVYMNFDQISLEDFNNVYCLNELIATQIELRVKYLKTELNHNSMLANLECLVAYLLYKYGFSHEEIAQARNSTDVKIYGRCDYIENRCELAEIHNLKDQIIDRLNNLRGSE